jgi:hypothetical protein
MFFEKSLCMKIANSIPKEEFSKGLIMIEFFKKLSSLTEKKWKDFSHKYQVIRQPQVFHFVLGFACHN